MSSFLSSVSSFSNIITTISDNVQDLSNNLKVSLIPHTNGVTIYVHTLSTIGFNSMEFVLKSSENIEFLNVPSSDGKTIVMTSDWSITEESKAVIYESSNLEKTLTNTRSYMFKFNFNEEFDISKVSTLLFSVVNTESNYPTEWTQNSPISFINSGIYALWGEDDTDGNREIILSGDHNINGFEIYITKDGAASGLTNAQMIDPSDWLIAAGPNGIAGAGVTSQNSQGYIVKVGPIVPGSTYEIVNTMSSDIHSHGEVRPSVVLTNTGTLLTVTAG